MYRYNEFKDKRELVLRKGGQSGNAHKNKGHSTKDSDKGNGFRNGSPMNFNKQSFFIPHLPRTPSLLPSLLGAEIEPPPQQRQYRIKLPPLAHNNMFNSPRHTLAYLDRQNAYDSAQDSLPVTPSPVANGKKSRVESYKTVMCQSWLENSHCHFGDGCRFAHGETDLRPVRVEPKQNQKYKTKLCDKYTTTGICPYGTRCLFIHPGAKGVDGNEYIRADKIVEIASRHAANEKHRVNDISLQTPLFVAGANATRTPLQLALSESPVNMKKDEQPKHLISSMRPLLPHPSWPLDPNSYKATMHERTLEKQTSMDNVLESLEKLVLPKNDSTAPLNIRNTPSPNQSGGGTKGTNTPPSGYVTGESSPGITSLLGDFKLPFNPIEVSPFALLGISSDSHYSSTGSISGDDDGQEMNLMLNFDFLKDTSFRLDEKPAKTNKEEVNQNVSVGYDPFNYTGLNAYANPWSNEFDRLW